MYKSGHIDSFTRDNLPDPALWPELTFDLPELQYPDRLNAAATLLTGAITRENGTRPAILWSEGNWTYSELQSRANQVAAVLTNELGLVAGNRVLLHGRNTPMMIASWYGILLAGGVAVTTMPLLRACELTTIADKANVDFALCEEGLSDELNTACTASKRTFTSLTFGTDTSSLEPLLTKQSDEFTAVDTAQDDVALLAFTSGTTGQPKACMHFHRDILAMADGYARHIVEPKASDVFCGSPPIAFTFGLGGIVVFPARFGAAVALPAGPTDLLATIERHRVSILFTAPTAYRAILSALESDEKPDIASLKKCISAGETLPAATWHAWYEKTGLKLIDGIGATEMIHIFISAKASEVRAGATGKPVPGYQACILDSNGTVLAPPCEGRLAVKGPTGCRYLDDKRQRNYVVNGWNLTGDTYSQDSDGYFTFVARSDDMIISSGYNIAGPEVEAALMSHKSVKECAVIGVPDGARGHIVKAFVVTEANHTDTLIDSLQKHVKDTIAPYKYPRAIAFVESIPKTQTGKIQRYKLKTIVQTS
ncbi:MAG: 2-aminobenzoate-CoA ligase [Kordiimonadales bacterium]|nr:MAG: 2-aminobenzoate-CoA ligase [Kordiimonadales bacterium]